MVPYLLGWLATPGIGERAYHPGFIAVAKALKKNHPDLLLHLGDFVYQPKTFPQTCPERYLHETRKNLADPFQFKLFVPGDNDLPPNRKKPKGFRVLGKRLMQWTVISTLTQHPPMNPEPTKGTMTIGNSFFAILNTYPWQDPKLWLAPRIKKAKNQGLVDHYCLARTSNYHRVVP